MKIKKLLWIALAFVGLSLTAVSCGEKDDKPFDPDNPNNTGTVEVGWEENGNTVKFTVEQSYGYGVSYTITYTCTFDSDGNCTRAIARYEFSSAELAEAFYESARQAYDDVSKSGKVVTIDETEDFEGFTKEELREVYESMANT